MKYRAVLVVILTLFIAGCVTPPVVPPVEEPIEVPPEVEPVEVEPVEPPPVPEPPEVVEKPEVAVEPVIETVALMITADIPGEDPAWYAAAAWLYRELSKEHDVVLIDMGERFSGSPFADIDQGSSVITLMNELPYAAALAGAGDFYHDALRLEELFAMADFPLVSTSIADPSLVPSASVTLGPAAVEFIGFSDPGSFSRLHWSQRGEAQLVEEHEGIEHAPTGYRILLSDTDLSDRRDAPVHIDLVLQRAEADHANPVLPIIETLHPLIVLFVEFQDQVPQDLVVEQYQLDALERDPLLEDLLKGLQDSQQQITLEAEQYVIDGINDKDSYGLTPLMNAIQQQEQLLVIARLLQLGASTESVDEYGMTPFMYAAWLHPSYRTAALLLRSSSDVDARDVEQWTALMRAVLNPNPEVLQAVLTEGADVDGENAEGWTALTFAAGFSEELKPIEMLLEAGADIDHQCIDGMTPLMYAAAFNHNPEMILLLLDAGADAQIEDYWGGSAYEYARQNRQLRGSDALDALERASHQQ